MKRLLIGLGILVAIPVGCSLYDFRKAVKLRTGAVQLCQVPTEKLEGAPYLTGKLGVINVAENRWEPLVGNYLPPDLMPARAEEIGTCVFLEWGSKVEGTFVVQTSQGGRKVGTHQEAAMRQNCKVTLVDRALGKIIGEKMIFGRPPSDGFISDGSGRSPAQGHKPIEELEAWLFELPRRP